jgi:hypothetical protein
MSDPGVELTSVPSVVSAGRTTEERLRRLDHYELLEDVKADLARWAKGRVWAISIIGLAAGFIGFGSLTVQVMKDTFEKKVDAKITQMNEVVAETKAVTRQMNSAVDEARTRINALDKAIAAANQKAVELSRQSAALSQKQDLISSDIEKIALTVRQSQITILAKSSVQPAAPIAAATAAAATARPSPNIKCRDIPLEQWLFDDLNRAAASDCGKALADSDVAAIAKQQGLEIAVLNAFIEVEGTPQGGFSNDKRPRVLFERTVFHRLTQGKYSQSDPDISNAGAGGYGPLSSQYARLQRAFRLDRNAALQAASWGLFGVLGLQYQTAGFDTVDAFARAMTIGEADQITASIETMARSGSLNLLRRKDWEGFARRYNGPLASQNAYPAKLAAAYDKHAK